MIAPMPPQITNLSPGDLVFVAWIDSNRECQAERVHVQEAYQPEDGLYVVDVSDESKRFQLVQSLPDACVAVDMADDPSDQHVIDADADISGRPVFGIERSAGPLLWQIQLRVLEMGYSPADALDLVALEFELYPSIPYAAARGVPEQELRAGVDDLVSEMAASVGL